MNYTTALILRILLVSFIIMTTLSCNQNKSESNNSNIMQINWTKLSTDGLHGDLQKGVSAVYAALINGKLIVAGGANFPDKLGFEGGSKAFYHDILLYNEEIDEWKAIGKLPSPSAYGVSVTVPDGALWIGGNNEKESLKSSFHVSLSSNDELTIKPFIDLPVAMDNFYGCSINDFVFLAGGSVNGNPSNSFYYINYKTDSEWTKLPDFPGIPRIQPVLTATEVEGKTYVYLMGGFFGGDANHKPAMATNVFKFDFSEKEWSKTGEQVDPKTKEPFSLGGATALTHDNRYIICFGGVNYDIFLDAITTQYEIANNNELTVEEKKEKNLEFSKLYMTQPVEYYKFNKECRVFDAVTGEWSIVDNTTNSARAGATLVFEDSIFYAVQGELKPGLRSAVTFRGVIE